MDTPIHLCLRFLAASLAAAAMAAAPAGAQEHHGHGETLGSVRFPTSC